MNEIREIVGNTTTTPNPCPDWNQTDETKADYIRNKPEIPSLDGYATEDYVDNVISGIPVPDYSGLATEQYVDDAIADCCDVLPNLQKGIGEGSIQIVNVSAIDDETPKPSKAISRNAIALGDKTIAGCKSFPITNFTDDYFEVEDPTALSTEMINAGGSLLIDIEYTDGDTTYSDYSYLWWNIIKIESISDDNKVYFTFKKPLPTDIKILKCQSVIFFDHPELGSEDYGENASATGIGAQAFGYAANAEGSGTRSIGNESHTEGYGTFATTYAHAQGTNTKAYGRTSHVEGKGGSAYGFGSHVEGGGGEAHGSFSHKQGYGSIAGDPNNTNFLYSQSQEVPVAAHAGGVHTNALSKASRTDGKDTIAGRRAYRIIDMEQLVLNTNTRLILNTVTGLQTGQTVTVVGDGVATATISAVSDPRGGYTRVELDRDILSAISKNAVDFDAETYTDYNYMIVHNELELGDIVVGNVSTAQGLGTIATCEAQSVQGRYNAIDNTNSLAHIVGGGTSDTDRKNIYTLDWSGNAGFAGDVYSADKKLATEEYVEGKIAEIPTSDLSDYKPEEHMQLLTTGDVVAFDITPNTTGRITITFNTCYFRYNGKRYIIQKNADGTYVSCTSGLTATTQMLVAKIGSSLNLYNADLAFRDVTKYVLADNEVILMVIAQTKNEASLCYPANLSTKVKYSVNGKVCGYQVIEDAVAKYDTVYVSTSGNDSNNGSTSALAFKTIGAALKTDAETIIVAPGTYVERFNAATVRNNLTIKVAHVARADDETLEEWKDRDTVIITAKNANGTFISQSVKYLTAFRNISNLVLEDIIFQETDAGSLCSIINCANFTIRNCQFIAAHDGHGLAINNSSGDVISCVAKYAGKDINGNTISTSTVHRDGFNIHTTGSVNIIDCIGAHNLDDGVSHHDATTGVVRGGEFHHNGKGGVASPTYGAKADIHDVWCHDNQYGIYAVTDADNIQTESINISNCVIERNNVGMRVDYYTVHSQGNVFKENIVNTETTAAIIYGSVSNLEATSLTVKGQMGDSYQIKGDINHRMRITQKHADGTNSEMYTLPEPDSNITSDKYYKIVTTKNYDFTGETMWSGDASGEIAIPRSGFYVITLHRPGSQGSADWELCFGLVYWNGTDLVRTSMVMDGSAMLYARIRRDNNTVNGGLVDVYYVPTDNLSGTHTHITDGTLEIRRFGAI
jgi:hypothetical protein